MTNQPDPRRYIGYEMTVQWDPSAAAQQAMKAAFIARANKGFKIKWPDGAYVLFYGTVGYTGAPGGGKQDMAIELDENGRKAAECVAASAIENIKNGG